jgi:autotransporter-associated beta strand protein
VLEGDYTFTSGAASNLAALSFGGRITPGAASGTTTLTLGGSNAGANTISGALADNGAGKLAVTKNGGGVWVLTGANTYSGDTTVLGGTLKFNVTSGTPSVGAGATATVAAGATLELAGTVSALGRTGGSRVHLVNNGTASGVIVSGTNQVVGGIDGTGTIQVNAGSDLTANHIVQSALVIGGASGSPARVTIDASDALGNPLDSARGAPLGQSSDGTPISSLTPSGLPRAESSGTFGADSFPSSNMLAGAGSSPSDLNPGGNLGGSAAAVPEPTTLLLALLGLASIGCLKRRSFLSSHSSYDLTTASNK